MQWKKCETAHYLMTYSGENPSDTPRKMKSVNALKYHAYKRQDNANDSVDCFLKSSNVVANVFRNVVFDFLRREPEPIINLSPPFRLQVNIKLIAQLKFKLYHNFV